MDNLDRLTELELLSPLQIFIFSFLAAAVGAVGALPEGSYTFSKVFRAIFYGGSSGTSIAMIGFDYLGGKAKPWGVIGTAWLIGLGYIKVPDLAVFKKLLNSVQDKTNGTNS